MSRILLLHASAGAGHQRAAEAVAHAIRERHSGAEAVVRDILEFTSPVFRTGYAKGYLNLVSRAPELWGYLYNRADRHSQTPLRRRLRSVFNRINARSFQGFYRELDPDAVVCTHFMPLQIVASMIAKGRTSAPLQCVVTDFAVHSLWIEPRVREWFVATSEASRFLIRQGMDPATVRVTGIPVDPVFHGPDRREETLREFGFDPVRPVALVLSGGFGVGPTVELVQSFAVNPAGVQLLVVAGRNPALHAKLQAAAAELSTPIRVFGFVNTIERLMDAADVVITKPGGLSTSETLARGRPTVLIDPIPGQEQRNSDYLLEQGAAVRLHEPADAPFKLQRLFENRPRLDRLRANVARIARPRAAFEIADAAVAAAAGSQPQPA